MFSFFKGNCYGREDTDADNSRCNVDHQGGTQRSPGEKGTRRRRRCKLHKRRAEQRDALTCKEERRSFSIVVQNKINLLFFYAQYNRKSQVGVILEG